MGRTIEPAGQGRIQGGDLGVKTLDGNFL